MGSVVAVAPSRVARTVLVPELLPAETDADAAEPAAMALRAPRWAETPAARAAEYAAATIVRRGDLVDVYC